MKLKILAATLFLGLPVWPSLADSTRSLNRVQVYVTAKDTGQRLSKAGDAQLINSPPITEKAEYVFVDPTKTFQTILGIGGALTDASAEAFYKLSEDKQREILRAYFDSQNGIGYTLGRTHIHSCDFSSESYTYVKEGDQQLDSFTIAHDLKYRIPFIKAAMAAAGKDFTLFASPWSPPGWMKDNGSMLHGGKLKPEFYSCWARYYAKFVNAYQQAGVPIWGLTIQNEPLANQPWESCIYSAEDERDFLKNYLGPELEKDGLGGVKILIWDHNRTLLYHYASVILDDPAAAKYVWGVGYHWYVNDSFENVQRLHESYPNTHLLFTEGCNGPFNLNQINDWQWGETYGNSMVNDFNNGVKGWTDWNVLLDEQGGPNHAQNFCFAPTHADTKTGRLYYETSAKRVVAAPLPPETRGFPCDFSPSPKRRGVASTLLQGSHYMNSYYYIGHFSKFIRPGARRVISSSTIDHLLTTAFLNPDGTVAVVVLNLTDKNQPFNVWIEGKSENNFSPAHSIITLIIS